MLMISSEGEARSRKRGGSHKPPLRDSGKALENGIHVLIEKPVTTTVSEAENLLKMAADSDLVLQVGHVEGSTVPFSIFQNSP